MTWRDEAACTGKPTRWWYPTDHPENPKPAERLAPAATFVCGKCPVAADCLTHALRHELMEGTGIWAATTPAERRRIRRGQPRHRPPAPPAPPPAPGVTLETNSYGKPIRHGTTSGYAYGCRCADCKNAKHNSRPSKETAA